MKTTFTLINLLGGILVLVFGLSAILNASHNTDAGIVGIIAVALSGICLWLGKESLTHPASEELKP